MSDKRNKGWFREEKRKLEGDNGRRDRHDLTDIAEQIYYTDMHANELAEFGVINANKVDLRTKPDNESQIVYSLVLGTHVKIVSQNGAWTKIRTMRLPFHIGYVSSEDVLLIF